MALSRQQMVDVGLLRIFHDITNGVEPIMYLQMPPTPHMTGVIPKIVLFGKR
jgi:hypothetical protein